MSSSPATIETGAVTAEALTWPQRAKSTTVTDATTYTAACELLKGIKALRQRISETFDSHISRAFQAHRALCREKQDAEAPLSEAEGILKRALVAFDDEQERLRRLEEARLREEARIREEQQQLEVAAAMELEAQRTDDHTLLLEAMDLVEQPVAEPTVLVQRTTPKVSGISFRETWKYKVVDLSKVPREYLMLDAVKVGGVVRALKAGTNIPGIQAYPDKGVGAGGGR